MSRGVHVEPAEVGGAEPLVEPAAQHPLGRLGLLEDLLVHERRVVAGVVRRGVDVELGGLLAGRRQVLAVGREPGRGDRGQLAVVEVGDRGGVPDQRGQVGGDVHLPVADADDQRAAVAGDHDPVREVGVHDGDAVGAVDRGERVADLALEGVGRGRGDQVGDHLGVGVGRPARPRGRPAAAGAAAALSMIPLWTTATVPAASVCGWALTSLAGPCVAQRVWPMPTLPANRFGQGVGQVTHPAGPLGDLDAAAAEHGDAGRVVAAVLQPGQSLEQDGRGLLAADVPDDSAHVPRGSSSSP